ncbi:MAG: 16S rRNA (uracil(1498)-N(3))-methyltransferase [Deltaproteobacteria bacterium]|nr:16S rRNA (uracil(1498)-N(3))-methyltransferase [Deltaproteobacteria bacterium]
MRIRRLALPPAATPPAPGQTAVLDPDQSRHALASLRLAPGSPVELTGPWGLAPGVVVETARRPTLRVEVRLTGPFAAPAARQGPELAMALIRGPRFDWAVEKAAELGVATLTPLVAERSGPAGLGLDKRARWRRLAEEARKQCGRPWPMTVAEPMPLAAWLDQRLAEPGQVTGVPPTGLLLEPSAPPFPARPDPRGALLVGPEGGFTPREKALALERGFQAVSLGPLPLRAETAALAALARLTAAGFD